jgi:hypothetical protein
LGEGKIRKEKKPPVTTLLFLNLFGETYGLGQGKIRKEKTK